MLLAIATRDAELECRFTVTDDALTVETTVPTGAAATPPRPSRLRLAGAHRADHRGVGHVRRRPGHDRAAHPPLRRLLTPARHRRDLARAVAVEGGAPAGGHPKPRALVVGGQTSSRRPQAEHHQRHAQPAQPAGIMNHPIGSSISCSTIAGGGRRAWRRGSAPPSAQSATAAPMANPVTSNADSQVGPGGGEVGPDQPAGEQPDAAASAHSSVPPSAGCRESGPSRSSRGPRYPAPGKVQCRPCGPSWWSIRRPPPPANAAGTCWSGRCAAKSICGCATPVGGARHGAGPGGRPGGLDLVVTLGGDGTVNEVVNGLMTAEPPTRAGDAPAERLPALATVPGGSTNVFARAVGLPREWPEAPA